MTGTAKQIAYANDIITNTIARIDALIARRPLRSRPVRLESRPRSLVTSPRPTVQTWLSGKWQRRAWLLMPPKLPPRSSSLKRKQAGFPTWHTL